MVDAINSVTTSAGHDPELPGGARIPRVLAAIQGGRKTGSAEPARPEASDDVKQVVEELNVLAGKIATTRISFKVDSVTGQSVVQVRDRETGDLIRQVPPKELLRLASNLKDVTGLIFNRKV